MNDPTMENLARRLGSGGKVLMLLILMVELGACEQMGLKLETRLRTAGTECSETHGICAIMKWRATGLVHGKDPELAEIILSFELQNTCNPDPAWFRAKDLEMEKIPQEKRPVAYRKRAEIDCSRILVTLKEIKLEDKHGLELYSYELPEHIERAVDPTPSTQRDPFGGVGLLPNRPLQIKFSVPKVYLKQINNFNSVTSFERIWVKGMKRQKRFTIED